jgi:lysophospholipase L1-like esterase
MRSGLPPAPKWAWAVIALGLVACAVMGYFVINRPAPPAFTAPAAAAEPSSSSPARRSGAPADPVRVLVVGDEFTAGSEAGGAGDAGWPQLVAADLTEARRPVEVAVAAVAGSGYVQPGADGRTLGQLLEGTEAPFDVVVFFGSENDTAAAADIQAAARGAYATAKAASPDARLVVIGPAWGSAEPPGYVVTDRDAVAAAAAASGATFVDPLELGWLQGDAALLTADGAQPTDAGHRNLADQIGPLVQTALEGTP